MDSVFMASIGSIVTYCWKDALYISHSSFVRCSDQLNSKAVSISVFLTHESNLTIYQSDQSTLRRLDFHSKLTLVQFIGILVMAQTQNAGYFSIHKRQELIILLLSCSQGVQSNWAPIQTEKTYHTTPRPRTSTYQMTHHLHHTERTHTRLGLMQDVSQLNTNKIDI